MAITAGLAAGSVALVGFGFDSGIEVAAATVVLWRLRADLRGGTVDEVRHRLALRFIAVTFFLLAGYVIVEGVGDLLTSAAPDTSPVGIALTGASIVVMPVLARAKRRAGRAMGSRLVVADAAETRLCAWLSGVDVRRSRRLRHRRVDVDRRRRRVRHRRLRGQRGPGGLAGRGRLRRLTLGTAGEFGDVILHRPTR